MAVVLRDYQTDLLRQAQKAAQQYRRVCLYGPTGSGKTEVGMALIDSLVEQGFRVTFTVNRLTLIEQASERFDAHGLDHGIIQRNHPKTNQFRPVQIASIQTISRRRMRPGTDVVIVDEAHGATSPTYREYLDTLDVPVFGLTATPFSKGLGKVFDTLVASTSIKELTEQGWLVPARYFAPDRPNLDGVRITAGDFNEADLDARMNTEVLVGNVVEEWKKRASQMKTVVFATSIAHSKAICEQFKLHGYKAEHLDAYTDAKDRKLMLMRFKRGFTQIIVNVNVLAEGFDAPDMECMVLARPTRSIIRYLQFVGRVLRPAFGKTEALILDHSSTVQRLGFATDYRPLILDDGSSKRSRHETHIHEPFVCPACSYVERTRRYPCAACGYRPDPKDVEVKVAEGTLKELRVRQLMRTEAQVIYSAFVAHQKKKGYKEGWAAHAFEQMMKKPPLGLRAVPGPMIRPVERYIVALNIGYAYRARKLS